MNRKLEKMSKLIKNYLKDEISNVKLVAVLIIHSVFEVTIKAGFKGR